MDEGRIYTDKISYEVFSILEANFLFGCRDENLSVSPMEASVDQQRGNICILSVDGGGMPGVTPAKALSYLETALKSKSGNPSSTISDYFDLAAGSGVGGIFIAMLFASKDGIHPIFEAGEMGSFLTKKRAARGGFLRRMLGGGEETGGGAAAAVKSAFRDDETGRSLTLRDTLKPILIPCYDLSSAAPFLFSRADALESDSFDFTLWEICSATAAEPGPVYINSSDGSIRCVAIDGRVAMSNPTAAAMTHVMHNKKEFPFVREPKDMFVVSIGAEVSPAVDCEKVKKWNGEDWVKALSSISGETSAEIVDQAVAMAFGENRESSYVRIQANGSRSWVENLKLKNVDSVLLGGKRIGEKTNAEKLDWVAEQLVLENRRRSSSTETTAVHKKANNSSC